MYWIKKECSYFSVKFYIGAIYYTSNSPQPTNYLTVVLTQSNILGYQSDYGNFNPTNWTADGQYRHNHALRMVLSSGGAFGELIDTTTQGHYEYRKYETTLPSNINNLDVQLYYLSVVAFVSESQSNIYSGAGTDVEYDPSLKIDLGLKNLTTLPTNYCFSSINPKIQVTNNSGKAITDFNVSFFLDGIENRKSFSGNLGIGDSTIIDWGNIPYSPSGEYKISFQGFTNINGNSVTDMNYKNDSYMYTGIGFTHNAFTNFQAGFDVSLPRNLVLDQSQNNDFVLFNSTKCGANNTQGAIRYALHSSWGVSGKPGPIIFGEADMTKLSSPILDFYYAYSDDQYGGTAPVIKVQVSQDCGTTWDDVNTITAVETGQPSQHGNWYIPASSDYKLVETNLGAYNDKGIILKITGIPGTGGNALYIDEISLSSATDVKDVSTSDEVSVYPNPAANEINLSNENYLGSQYSICSILGVVVAQGTNTNNKIDISRLDAGCYYIKINNRQIKFIKN